MEVLREGQGAKSMNRMPVIVEAGTLAIAILLKPTPGRLSPYRSFLKNKQTLEQQTLEQQTPEQQTPEQLFSELLSPYRSFKKNKHPKQQTQKQQTPVLSSPYQRRLLTGVGRP